MGVVSSLLALAAVIVVGIFIAQPFFAPRGGGEGGGGAGGAALRRRAGLLAERNRLYAAIRELDFDHSVDKVSDEEYAQQRYRLVAQGVEVLQQLDALPEPDAEEDPLEQLIAAARSGGPLPATAAPAGASFCPQCGQRAQPGDRFCAACGAAL